jgi:hypothetical protein
MFNFLCSSLRRIFCSLLCIFDKLWKAIKSVFCAECCFESTGTIVLGSGRHEILIKTDPPSPSSVFLCAEEPCDSTPACVGDLNWTAACVVPEGFILYADVKTNSCVVRYTVRY